MDVLITDGVCHSYGGVRAVDGLSLTVSSGERVAIIGPNGAGKTTFLNCLSGMPAPTGGTIRFNGADITRLSAHRRAQLGITRSFQTVTVLPALTLEENALLAVLGHSRSRYGMLKALKGHTEELEEARSLLEWAKLSDRPRVPASELSYGEQRRLDLALTLAGRPSLYLLDEPSAGLTHGETLSVAQMISELPDEVAVIVVDHDIDFVFAVATRVVVMHRGQKVAEGTADEIRDNTTVREAYFGGALVSA